MEIHGNLPITRILACPSNCELSWVLIIDNTDTGT